MGQRKEEAREICCRGKDLMGHHQVPNNSAPDTLTIERREIDWQLCLF